MDNMPAKTPVEQTEVDVIPTWRDLGDRFRDVMKDIGAEISTTWKKEGKELESEMQSRLLPSLKRARIEIDRLITKLEEYMAKRKQ
jgi:hypothetical protein